ncbi:TetR/AcrR family transcriptional regulator [Agromyces sp. SYSU T00194]|uniref:TetR/AcrR family transcriptional regulator n=1 Tax=Agromyces chitinivorans TaxID=3158560 RepID=UPI003397D054
MTPPLRRRAGRKSPEARAEQIQAAARSLALDQGLSALTLRGIAARIDVTPALVSHYQPNMDALVATTFASIVSEEIEEVAAMLAELPTPTARLSAAIDTLLDAERDDVTVVWVEAWSMGRRSDALASAIRGEMDAWHDVLRELVEAGVAAGEFETDTPDAVAWQLLGMIDGLNAQALVRWGDPGERGSMIGRAVEGMLGLARGALGAGAGADVASAT